MYSDMRGYACVCGSVINYGEGSYYALHSAVHLTAAGCSGCYHRSNPDDRKQQWRQKRIAEDEKALE